MGHNLQDNAAQACDRLQMEGRIDRGCLGNIDGEGVQLKYGAAPGHRRQRP